jgi:preprotein translocase subunit SecB
MSAALQFKDYHVIESHYKYHPFQVESIGDENYSDVSPKIYYNLETNPESIEQAIIFLGIELGDSSFSSTNFYAKVRIAGVFEIHERPEEMTEEQILGFYKVNAVAILFPYLRGIVSEISSKGSEGPIILPTMNIVNMINENEFKEKSHKFDDLS